MQFLKNRKFYLFAPVAVVTILFPVITYFAFCLSKKDITYLHLLNQSEQFQFSVEFASIFLVACILPFLINRIISYGTMKIGSLDSVEEKINSLCDEGIRFLESGNLAVSPKAFLAKFRAARNEIELVTTFSKSNTVYDWDDSAMNSILLEMKQIVTGFNSQKPVAEYILVSRLLMKQQEFRSLLQKIKLKNCD